MRGYLKGNTQNGQRCFSDSVPLAKIQAHIWHEKK